MFYEDKSSRVQILGTFIFVFIDAVTIFANFVERQYVQPGPGCAVAAASGESAQEDRRGKSPRLSALQQAAFRA